MIIIQEMMQSGYRVAIVLCMLLDDIISMIPELLVVKHPADHDVKPHVCKIQWLN